MQKSLIFLLTIFILALLSACGSTPEKTSSIPSAPPLSTEETLTPQTSQLTKLQTEKLRHYVELSNKSEGPLRQQYILEMAEWLYEQLELTGAMQTISKLKIEFLSPNQIMKSQLLKARIMLSLGQNINVLQTLPTSFQNLSAQQQLEVLDIQAQAFLGANYQFESIRTRIKLNSLLRDKLELDDNQYTIWRTLNLMPLNSLKQINTLPLDNETRGWIELAITTKNNQNNWQELEYIYQNWAQQNPNHPAGGTFLSTLAKNQIDLIKHPKHIALLLPVSGKHASAARAIRDGFISAHYYTNSTGNTEAQPEISVIDVSNKEIDIWQHYQSAIQSGADFIVGPLSKKSIDDLSKAKDLDVPVLTFNYAEQQTSVTDNLFQFGLLPEDEAAQIAELAIRQGKKHSAILAPDSPWGQRLQGAFQQRFEELGGEVRSIKTYDTKRNDFSNSITNLLNLTQSKQRYNRIKKILPGSIKFEAYRRQDIDMIFIAGQSRAARSILPQLKFHQASDLQVYSTSHAFSGFANKSADRDINQLIYCDIPWVLEPNSIKSAIEKSWPNSSKRYTRLYALGADAYHLIPYLGRLKARSDERFNGYTGNLYLDPLLRVHRELISAQFTNGKPEPLSPEDMSIIYQPPQINDEPPEVSKQL